MDRRIKKTQTAIISATVSLLSTMPMKDLSIKEICNKADVSRSTFYLHYCDAADVVEQLYNDISVNVTRMLDKFDFSSLLSNPKPFLELICDFLNENLDLYQLLMKNNYHSNFRRRLKGILESKVLEENSYRYKNRVEFEYSVNFIMSGMVETICDNMSDLSNDNREKLISTLTRQIASGFSIK